MAIWFISDTHLGEQPMRRQKLSGMTACELDALIERNWRTKVAKNDEVWHLGDLGKNWRRIAGLPGIKHLVLAHAADRKPAIEKSGIFASTHEKHVLAAQHTTLFLVHDPDPYVGSARQDIVHGHHHYKTPSPGRRSVCVDHINWGPIGLDELLRHV